MVNDNAEVGLMPAIMIFLLIAVGAIGFLMLTNEFNIHYDNVIKDPTNNTGIMAGNNSSAYTAVKVTSDTITANLPVGIMIGFLFLVIIILLFVWVIVKR